MSANRLGTWLSAARPKTLGAAVAPVVMGTAMAYKVGIVDWLSTCCALVGAMLIQIGTNLANDYSDFVKGTDTAERLGPTRATQAGLVSPKAMRNAAMAVFLLACVPGTYIVWRGGWPFVAVGFISIACGVLYTAGPFALGYIGLADVFVLFFFGPVALAGTYYLHTLHLTREAIVAGFAPGFLSVALLTVNNLRDIDEDRRARKRSLAVRFGAAFARREYAVCIMMAGLFVPSFLVSTAQSRWFVLVPLVTFALGTQPLRAVLTGTTGRDLNRVLAQTGRLLLAYSVAFAVGWLL